MSNLTTINDIGKKSIQGLDKGNIELQRIFNTDHNFSSPIIKEVTPEKAEKILSLNKKNRSLRRRHVQWLALQMELGYWVFCGQLIGIDKNGVLINLQHTLNALIESKTTQRFICLSGLDSRAIEVMDTGVARTAGDVLQMNGIKNATNIASTVSKVLAYESGKVSSVATGAGDGNRNYGVKKSASFLKTNTIVLERVKSNLNYWQENHKASATFYRSFTGLSQSSYGSLYHFMSALDEEDAWEFFSKLSTGIALQRNSPIYVVRKKLEKEILSKVKHSGREKLFWVVTAWNKFRKKEPMLQMTAYNPKVKIPELI